RLTMKRRWRGPGVSPKSTACEVQVRPVSANRRRAKCPRRARGGLRQHYAKLDTEAESLVSASADVIVAHGTPGLVAARKSTRTIAVWFTEVADPVGQRLIDSLASPVAMPQA